MFNLIDQNIGYHKKVALHDFSLHVMRGEKIALLGKSGSGKSTLLHHLFSLYDKASLIPQELGLVQNLSVYHNVYMGRLESHGTFKNMRNLIWPCKDEVVKVQRLLHSLELESLMFQKVGALSGGQKQRTAIARALYKGANLLLADEPVSALDEQQSKTVMHSLSTSFETFIVALHDVDLALRFCDRVIGIKEGYKVLDKPSKDITDDEKDLLYKVC